LKLVEAHLSKVKGHIGQGEPQAEGEPQIQQGRQGQTPHRPRTTTLEPLPSPRARAAFASRRAISR